MRNLQDRKFSNSLTFTTERGTYSKQFGYATARFFAFSLLFTANMRHKKQRADLNRQRKRGNLSAIIKTAHSRSISQFGYSAQLVA